MEQPLAYSGMAERWLQDASWDGTTINIWIKPWLGDVSNPYLTTQPPIELRESVHSHTNGTGSIVRKVWRCKVPPKVKNLICNPSFGWLKVNADAVSFLASAKTGFGMVARRDDGSFVVAHTISTSGLFSSRMMEIMGVREALS
ncbi:conserved hypothetical protein [Ricinus communis]|uniref:Uncharacterized protein n=1 Tax=Ricinus communis TaxID=3988 RepID=B9SZF2_RICCO|nr:conserved hypothetical protein [Ricinus communis]